MGVSATQLALAKTLAQVPKTPWPLQLTPRTSFHLGIAALVFAGPRVLSPADDVAEFGAPNPDQQGAKEGGGWFFPPYEGARVVAWFRPPQANRKYNVDFECEAGSGGPFTLESSDGNTETVDVQLTSNAAYATATEHISSTFEAGNSEWRWFSLSCPTYWRLSYCELNALP